MPIVKVTTRAGEERVIEGAAGVSLKDVLVSGGVDEINAIGNCGGCCSCGTCHIFVESDHAQRMAPMRQDEDDLLYVHDNRSPASRLAWQVVFSDELDGLATRIAPE